MKHYRTSIVPSSSIPRQGQQSGFALVATISVMVLLVMIALAMLSLSTIELRSSRQGEAMAEAQANARMALMIALGELQKHAGPDQRVTVSAGQWDSSPESSHIDGVNHPRLVAVYQSRTMDDEMNNALPQKYYDRSTNFLSWLVSHSDPSQLGDDNFAQSGSFTDEIILTEPTYNEDNSLKMNGLKAGRVFVAGGAYGWGISDESMKYRLNDQWNTAKDAATSVAMTMARSGLPGDYGHEILDSLSSLNKQSDDLEKYITSDQLALIRDITGEAKNLADFLTPYALSQLTDVKKGGFKNCLNMLLELEEAELPADYKDMQDQTSRWGGSTPLNGRKFSDDVVSGSSNSTEHDTLPISLLHRYYKTARMGTGNPTPNTNDSTNVSLTTEGRTTQNTFLLSQNSSADRYWRGYGHSLRLIPVVMRTREVIYATADKISEDEYRLGFISIPVVTLWNPYNIDMTLPSTFLRHRSDSADAVIVHSGGTTRVNIGVLKDYKFGSLAGKDSIHFTAGETKVFFPDLSAAISGDINFINKWPANLNQIKNLIPTQNSGITGSGSSMVSVSLFPAERDASGGSNITNYYDGWAAADSSWRGTKIHNWDFDLRRYQAELGKEGKDLLIDKSLSTLADGPWPIAILDVGIKSADHATQPGTQWIFDYPQRMNVTPHYAAAGEDLEGGRQASPMVYSFTPLRGNTDLSANLHVSFDSTGALRDFVGYSFNPSRGSSHITLCELPFVPLHSLGQLQHLPLQDEGWRHDSIHPHTPTWTFGVGNSWAHPWLSPTALTESRNYAFLAKWGSNTESGYKLFTDRLWCANSLLWDSYTFTTMAPQDTPWFDQAGTSRSLSKVYDNFFGAEYALPNDRLGPWPGTDGEKLKPRIISSSGKPTQDAHKILPANLGLKGGININSTSVEVWKLLLASTFKAKVPTQSPTAGSQMTVNESAKYVVSRYTQPTGPSIDGNGDPYTDGFSGYRELDKEQIEDLAEAIVVEIKKRGPFRSIAEFVNRQRSSSSSDGKAIYGVIQAALESEGVDINKEYQSDRFTTADFPEAQFTNPAAIDGPSSNSSSRKGFSRARGIPGYVTQADILTPLAPVITARGDTFTIYSYGESRDAEGNVIARARCKAVVQRTPEFLDSAEEAETPLSDLTSQSNIDMGRKFKIISFEWMSNLPS